MGEGKRIVWIDYARAFAIVCVVLCHVVDERFYPIRIGEASCSGLELVMGVILFNIGRLGVPFFLLITGTLLLNIQYQSPELFYKKRVLPMFTTLEIWIVINYISYCVLFGEEFKLKHLVAEMILKTPLTWNHMWYMPVILGIYLFIPFIAIIVQKVDFRQIMLPLILAFYIFVFVPYYGFLVENIFHFMPNMGLIVDLSFSGGLYGLYLILGYYIVHKNILKKIKTSILIIISCSALMVNSGIAILVLIKEIFDVESVLGYASPFLFINSVSLFEIFKRIDCKSISSIVFSVSKGSFVIYLVHNIAFNFLNLKILSYIPIVANLGLVSKTAISFILTFGCSLLIYKIFDKIFSAKVKRYCLFLK